jgi:hypothetical protein
MTHKKWNTVIQVDNSGVNVENVLSTNRMIQKNVAKAVKKEEEVKERTEKCVALDNPAMGLPVEVMMEEPEDEPVECVVECGEYLCVWLSKEQDMIFFDQMEHEHLPEQDMPPNNIQRKKLYRKTTLHIQAGQVQKGVRHQLPNCIEIGTCELFPSPIANIHGIQV